MKVLAREISEWYNSYFPDDCYIEKSFESLEISNHFELRFMDDDNPATAYLVPKNPSLLIDPKSIDCKIITEGENPQEFNLADMIISWVEQRNEQAILISAPAEKIDDIKKFLSDMSIKLRSNLPQDEEDTLDD